MEIAVVNKSSQLSNIDVEFAVQACASQVVECATAWGIPALAVAFYATEATLPASDVYICRLVDQLDVDGALGYHSVDPAGRPYLDILVNLGWTVTLSHECLETLVDPTADKWWTRPDGSQVAAEVCDPVEGDTYQQSATVLGETRLIDVSNYVTPSWSSGTSDFDRMGELTAPFTMSPGGYMVVLDQQGNENDVFARLEHGSIGAAAKVMAKLADPRSRLAKRLRWPR